MQTTAFSGAPEVCLDVLSALPEREAAPLVDNRLVAAWQDGYRLDSCREPEERHEPITFWQFCKNFAVGSAAVLCALGVLAMVQ